VNNPFRLSLAIIMGMATGVIYHRIAGYIGSIFNFADFFLKLYQKLFRKSGDE
jgi:hypothetical protein